MKKPRFPLWGIVVLALLLVGAAVAVNIVRDRASGNAIAVFDEHDHDHDGKPDHGADHKD